MKLPRRLTVSLSLAIAKAPTVLSLIGCTILLAGRYRVDFVFELEAGVLLLEYDEDMHADRDKRCELVRQAEVSLGYGDMPFHWIRFYPRAFEPAFLFP